MDRYQLHSKNQYGYKKNHSIEMLILKVVNDLLIATDKKIPTLSMLRDLGTAFDTVDQRNLLKNLQNEIGIRGTALAWFMSFLLDRTQKVKVVYSYSRVEKIDYGVGFGTNSL